MIPELRANGWRNLIDFQSECGILEWFYHSAFSEFAQIAAIAT
jgi:hypothetical protein